MSAIEDWYGSGCINEDGLEDEQIFHDCMDAKIDELVKERMPQHVSSLRPMQLMSQMNETLSKESDLFGKVLYIQGIFKPGNGVLYKSGYYYDNIKDENNATQIKVLIPALVRQKMKPDSLIVLSGMVTKHIDALRSSVELQFRVDSVVEEVKAKAILELFHHEDVTGEVTDEIENDLTEDDKAASKKAKPHRSALNFFEMGMEKGDVLHWKEDPTITITVHTDRTVLFDGKEMAISAVTRGLKDSKWYVAPGAYWLYNDRLLNEIYDETYPVEE